MSRSLGSPAVEVAVENVGGIDETTVTLGQGVTVLAGRNATNRTSLLRAVKAALGGETTALKGDADAGQVELTIDGETYTRTLKREGGNVTTGGAPYFDEPEPASLFAFLLEDNPARRAVETGADLREVLLGPVDTEQIEAEIERHLARKRDLSTRLEELEQLRDERTDLAAERSQLDETIEETRASLAEVREAIEAADASVEESKAEQAELESTLDDLGETRNHLEEVRYSLETERESLSSLREEHESLQADVTALDDPDEDAIADIDSRIERHRGRKAELESSISQLRSIIQFNESQLEGDGVDTPLPTDADGAVTDRLVDDEQVACWTCGSEVASSQITETLDQLRELRTEQFERRNDVESEIADLEAERQSLREQRDRRASVADRIDSVEQEIDRRETQVEALIEQREELQAAVERLEAEAAAHRGASEAEILEHHRRASELAVELDQYEDERAELSERLADIDDRLAEREALEAEREAVRADLEDLRTRVDRIETEAVESFNEHMAEMLDVLAYENVERIWIERTERERTAGRQTVTESVFDLHVVRTTDSGTTYEDTVDHLSESERTVTGLVFALAGYLVYDVYESVPFLLLDSLEAIDSDRIAAFVSYLSEYAPNVVVALLPEDAQALPEDSHYVRDI